MSFYINSSQIGPKTYPGLLFKLLGQCYALQWWLSSGSYQG